MSAQHDIKIKLIDERWLKANIVSLNMIVDLISDRICVAFNWSIEIWQDIKYVIKKFAAPFENSVSKE